MFVTWQSRIVKLSAPLLLLASTPNVLFGVGMEAQRIVVRRCIPVLPPDLRAFFEARAADFEERTLEPESAWDQEGELRSRHPWHFLRLDATAQNGSTSARLAAAESFPRREADAKKLFKDLGLGKDGGRLPWALEDLSVDLVKAFEQGDADEIIRAAGYLTHFVWDASQPFNATINHDGRQSGNLRFGEPEVGQPNYAHQAAQHRLMGELVRRNRNRYLDAVRVQPMDLKPAPDPLDSVFHHMVGALGRLEDLLLADREILTQLGVKDADSFNKREDEYYQMLDARCGEVVTDRLRAASVLSATLVAGAWERAGRPRIAEVQGLTTAEPEAPPAGAASARSAAKAPDPKAPDQATPPGNGFVGSGKSPVYHRPSCEHAKKISHSNLVQYASPQEAEQQGKRPCRVCKPN